MSKTFNHCSLLTPDSATPLATLRERQGRTTGGTPTDSLLKSAEPPTQLSSATQWLLSTQYSALFLLIGLPGSGKSTWAKQLLAECPQMQLISTDGIRGQLFGNEAIQGHWLLIWREIRWQLQQANKQGKTVIYDATNAQRRHRREMIALAREFGFPHITGLWADTPVWLCLARNQKRDAYGKGFTQRQVPEEVIFKMHRQLRDAPPSLEDGLDSLIRLSGLREYGNCTHATSENPT